MTDIPPLEREIRKRIQAAGPMPVGQYMALCLGDPTHGYYVTRDPLGASGDFTTAPEVSQMFGELIGLWMAAVWTQMGSPENIRAGRARPRPRHLDEGRAARHAGDAGVPRSRRAASGRDQPGAARPAGALARRRQRAGVLAQHARPRCRRAPLIVVANEFFDALPVNQAVKTDDGWHERRIGIDADGKLAFTVAPEPMPHADIVLPPAVRDAPPGAIFEWRDERAAMELGRRLADERGAALVIDYGHAASDVGETLQAVGRHAYADVLSTPGTVDLTAHVDFQALKRAVEAMGVNGFGPIDQSQLLRGLGIETRAAKLKARATPAEAAEIDLALRG